MMTGMFLQFRARFKESKIFFSHNSFNIAFNVVLLYVAKTSSDLIVSAYVYS